VTQIEGQSVEEFFHRVKHREAEELVADFAHINIAAATHVEAMWDRLLGENDQH
jgi:hypothetical protein